MKKSLPLLAVCVAAMFALPVPTMGQEKAAPAKAACCAKCSCPPGTCTDACACGCQAKAGVSPSAGSCCAECTCPSCGVKFQCGSCGKSAMKCDEGKGCCASCKGADGCCAKSDCACHAKAGKNMHSKGGMKCKMQKCAPPSDEAAPAPAAK